MESYVVVVVFVVVVVLIMIHDVHVDMVGRFHDYYYDVDV
jgi:hypothetical protein